jgi:hypothetical protein
MLRSNPHRPQGPVAIAGRGFESGSREGVGHGGWRMSASHIRYAWIASAGIWETG